MGQMKRFAEEVSVLMGYEGEINDFVLEVAEAMFPQAHKLGFCAKDDDKEDECNKKH
jgi:hypothetical protein